MVSFVVRKETVSGSQVIRRKWFWSVLDVYIWKSHIERYIWVFRMFSMNLLNLVTKSICRWKGSTLPPLVLDSNSCFSDLYNSLISLDSIQFRENFNDYLTIIFYSVYFFLDEWNYFIVIYCLLLDNFRHIISLTYFIR